MMIFFVFLAFCARSFGQFDCSKEICDVCGGDNVPVDFVFIIDASPSMQPPIDEVRKGLQAMATEIGQKNVDPRFWVVLTGHTEGKLNKNELVITEEASIDVLKEKFGQIRARSGVSGFQDARGGIEPTFEAMRMAFREESWNTYDHENVGGRGTISLRSGARTFLLVLTNEDSDGPVYASNANKYGYDSTGQEPSSLTYSNNDSPFVKELKRTIFVMDKHEVTLYMFVNEGSGVSRKQYGTPTCDKSISNFDRKATLKCLKDEGLGPSLIGSLLEQGNLARVFNIDDITKSGFVDSVLTDAVANVAQCQMKKRKRADEPACAITKCTSEKGCHATFTCAEGCDDQCLIDGVCYRAFDQNPAGGCGFCIPEKSTTAWSTCSGPAPTTCEEYVCVEDLKFCGILPTCSAACNRCKIGEGCYDAGQPNPDNACEQCDVTSPSAWTNTCPDCAKPCQNGGVCQAAGGTCNCAGTGFVGDDCTTAPTCTPACQNNARCVVDNMGAPGCDCDGTAGFSGVDCGTCAPGDPCEVKGTEKACPATCANQGICNTDTGMCNCDGTGFIGPTCTLVDTNTPMPAVDTQEMVCQAACAKKCAETNQIVDNGCVCNAGQVSVTCSSDGSPTTTSPVTDGAVSLVVSTLVASRFVVFSSMALLPHMF